MAESQAESRLPQEGKMIIKRSLISPPYAPPKFVFKRIKDFVMHVLQDRCPKPLEEIKNDFHELEPCAIAFLALGVVDHFEIQLADMTVVVAFVESFDKSAEDMSPPIAGLLEPLDNVELALIICLKGVVSQATTSLIKVSNALNLKVVKLQVIEPQIVEQAKQEEKA
jgi:hypothetical protein